MSIKYLSPSGLTEVWSNIKTYIASKIPSKIVTGLSIKGRTITYTNSDGTTGTLTTQDTNTTYASMSATEATTGTETTARSISAKVLHDKITSITNTKANDSDVVHKSGNETIAGTKTFSNVTYLNKELAYKDTKYDWTDTSLDTWCDAGHVYWSDKTGNRRMHELVGTKDGVWQKACYINENPYFAVNSNRDITYWGTTIAFNGTTTFTSPIIGNLQGNADTATKANDPNAVHKSGNETINGFKTFTSETVNTSAHAFRHIFGNYGTFWRHDGTNLYLMLTNSGDQYGGWNDFRPLRVNLATGICDISGTATNATYTNWLRASSHADHLFHTEWDGSYFWTYVTAGDGGYRAVRVARSDSAGIADTATKATTQATTDNSTKIATTAWVRTYVNSAVGSGSIGTTVTAYYSNATTLTANDGQTASPGASYPPDYSGYINIAPTVGTIYTGSQLFSSFTPTASGTISKSQIGPSSYMYYTTAKATVNFSGTFSASAKYLCTTANAVKFRAYVSQGTSSAMGAASIVDNSSSKSIFLRVQ